MNSKKSFSNKYTTGIYNDSKKEQILTVRNKERKKEIQLMGKEEKICKLNERERTNERTNDRTNE